MVSRRYLFFALSAVCVLASAAVTAAVLAVERGVALLFRALAPERLALREGFGGHATPHGPALAYAGPPVHALRHEAGVSRRSAARHT